MTKSFWSTSILSGIATITKLIAAFVIAKIVAINSGANGLAVLGQLQSYTMLLIGIIAISLQTGIIATISKVKSDTKQLTTFLDITFSITLIASLLVAIVTYSFQSDISRSLFDLNDYQKLIAFFSGCIFFAVFNTLVIAILNGLGAIKTHTLLIVVNNSFLIIVLYLVAKEKDLIKTLYVFIASYIAFGIGAFISLKKSIKYKFTFIPKFYKHHYSQTLAKYFTMGIATAIVAPFTFIIIRKVLNHNLGIESVGQWEAIWKISEGYMLFISITLSFYLIPKMSGDKTTKDSLLAFRSTLIASITLTVIGGTIIWLMKETVISILFTKDFFAITPALKYQLLGNLLRAATWILSLILITKQEVKSVIFVEVFFSTTFIAISLLLFSLQSADLSLITKAYGLNQICSITTLILIFSKKKILSLS